MFGEVILDNLDSFGQAYVTTVVLAVAAMALALAIGTVAASIRVWGSPIASGAAGFYVEFFRNTPLLVQLFFYATLFAPLNLGITSDPVIVAIIGLGIYTGAFVTEAIRSGILAVDPRQLEAARSLGLSQVQTLRLVVLPQAFRTVIPPLGNLSIALVKNTSIASAISAREILFVGLLVQSRTFSLEPFVAILAAYWSLTIPLSIAVSRLERRMAFSR
ncbi:MAG TPA: amino acid ABC transporter permease [Candidatus Limnocylindria bacterium]|nr:amino acid ABC transporter permease [Candidatus Limnocylindria bacterium]